MSIAEKIKGISPQYIALRHELHSHPETAFQEHRTSELVAKTLESLGIETHQGLAGTGVVGIIRNGNGLKSIGLRADMDALPLQEKNNFSHRSRIDGCMHACGHDGHTAMLLAAADYLSKNRNFNGTVYLIFQPAEETEGGGRVMVEQGLFERFPMDAVFGLHNWPGLAAGQFAIHNGPVMASADRFDISISGHGAHAAMPHQGNDVIVAGSSLIQSLQSIVSRVLDPLDSAVLSITRFQAGEAYNILPDKAHLAGTVRAFSQNTQERIEEEMCRICKGVSETYGVHINLEMRRGYPATVNTGKESDVCMQVARDVVGSNNVHLDMKPSMGAEDFSFMLLEKPGCYVWLGNGLGEGGCMLHNPHYDFNDAILMTGAEYWVRLVEKCLNA